MLKNTTKTPTVTLEIEIIKKYVNKKYFAFLHFIKIDSLKFYELYIVERVEETGIRHKKEFCQALSIDCPMEEIEKIVKEKIGDFEVVEGINGKKDWGNI